MKIEAKGTDGGNLNGRWRLSVETGENPLIRKAEFFVGNPAQPIAATSAPFIVVTNSGTVNSLGLCIAQAGIYKAGNFEFHVRVIDVRNLNEGEAAALPLYKEVMQRISEPLPEGSDIMDMTGSQPKAVIIKRQ